MAYVKEHPPSEVYHLTKKENLNSILEDGMIRRFSDMECWFCVDLQKMKAYMERTVMCEGKPYYSVAGQLCRYPQFVPEDYVLLKGQRTQYYIADTHPAIISKHDFEKVQTLLGTKKAQYTKAQQKSRFPFAKKLCCRECGSTLRRKDQKGSAYWCCMTHDADKNECALPPIPETQIQQAFLRLYYNLKHQGSRILPDLITNLQSIRERKFLWSVDVIELNKQIAELTSQNQLLATLRESGCVDSDIFISKSNKLTEQLRAAKQAKSRLLNQDGDDAIPCTQELITILKRGPETLHDFDGELFGQLIDKVIIESNTSLRFRLKNGLELRESIERTVR